MAYARNWPNRDERLGVSIVVGKLPIRIASPAAAPAAGGVPRPECRAAARARRLSLDTVTPHLVVEILLRRFAGDAFATHDRRHTLLRRNLGEEHDRLQRDVAVLRDLNPAMQARFTSHRFSLLPRWTFKPTQSDYLKAAGGDRPFDAE